MDRFLEAQGHINLGKAKAEEQTPKPNSGHRNTSREATTKGVNWCFLYDKTGHQVADCWSNTRASYNPPWWKCGKPGHKANSCSSMA